MVSSAMNLNNTKTLKEMSKNFEVYYKTSVTTDKEGKKDITLSPCRVQS
jgi:hypothetical protein